MHEMTLQYELDDMENQMDETQETEPLSDAEEITSPRTSRKRKASWLCYI